jgi:hypothetical protein
MYDLYFILHVPPLFRGAQFVLRMLRMSCCGFSCSGLCIGRVARRQRIAHPACSARIEVIDRTARSARRE